MGSHASPTKEMTMSRSKQNKDAPPKAIKKGESKKHDERKKKDTIAVILSL
jgi:hypothetical protein